MGDDQPRHRLPRIREARRGVLSGGIRRKGVGDGLPRGRSPLRLLHDAPPRRILDVPHGAVALQRRGRHAVRTRRGEGAGRRVPPAGSGHPLLLFAHRLVAGGCAARPHGARHGTSGRKGGCGGLFRLHEGATHRTAHAIRPGGGDLVRRRVEPGRKSRVRLAPGRTVRTDPHAATGLPGGEQPPPHAVRGRGRADLRTRPAGREHGGTLGRP